jgi:hypothetical protein
MKSFTPGPIIVMLIGGIAIQEIWNARVMSKEAVKR